MTNLIIWLAVAANVGAAIYGGYQAIRCRRLASQWEQLDALLSQMAFQSFHNHHIPLWAAWSAVMGEISVEITQNRGIPKSD